MRIIGHQRLLLQETWQHEYKQLKNITIVADLKSISLFPRALIVAFLFHNNDLKEANQEQGEQVLTIFFGP